MSRSHESISCDSCHRSNFTGKRFKCLICRDYDLCERCHVTNSGRHSSKHPMQVILTQTDKALFLGDEPGPALTCPICGKLGQTVATLETHLLAAHSDQMNKRLMCPACALLSIREANLMTEDLDRHLSQDHLQRMLDERRRDPIGELLSTLSRRGQNFGRPSSTFSLLHPLSASSSGLSLPIKAIQPPQTKPNKPENNAFLLDSKVHPEPSQEELEHIDEIRAARSAFTVDLLYSALHKLEERPGK